MSTPLDLPDSPAVTDLIWGPKAAGRSVAAKTQSERVLQMIHEDIISGRYAPGEKLKPEELKERYGLGLSPIREALLRLTAEGLVSLEGQRGFQVPPASVAELQDIAKVRTQLSCWALRQSIELGDDKWEAAVVAAFHRLERIYPLMVKQPRTTSQEWEARNREFHAALESACGSPWLSHFNAVAFSQSERYRRHFVEYGFLLPDAQKEHHDIMLAAINRRVDEACEHLRRHINENMQVVLGCMTERSKAKPRSARKAG
jgi:GntR family transcriptional regulator, carbon starvation induced regulator